MFLSEPICILRAGPAIDGRNVDQVMVDDIAETYNPKVYNARINEEHWGWGDKFGSVLSLEKREDEVWAILKPNSKLLGTIEDGQLLHTSCEITPDYAKTGKYYLTGLALTDSPASLGTTEMHLSSRKNGEVSFCSGSTISIKKMGKKLQSQDEQTFFSRLMNFMGNEKYHSNTDKEPKMSKEIEELLKKGLEQNEELSKQLQSLVTVLSVRKPEKKEDDALKLSVEAELKKLKDQVASAIALSNNEDSQKEPETQKTTVENQIEELSSQVSALIEKLNKTGDEQSRRLGGEEQEKETYY